MKKINELIELSDSILILTHKSPDGDAVGSSLALYNAFANMYKKVDIIIEDVPKLFNFMPNFDKIEKESSILEYDLVVVVDCATYDRIGQYNNKYFENAKFTLNIDHHISNTKYANYNYISSSSPACCEYLVDILDNLNIEINEDIAKCLMVGILTDTGGFQYTNVNKKTFNFASRVSSIIDIPLLYKKVLSTQTKPQFELTKIAISRLEFLLDKKVAFTYINNEDFKLTGASYGDHEGIVNIGRNVEGVEVSIFIRETLNGYRVSLRGNGIVDVSILASLYGGGGHKDSAGFDSNLSFEELKKSLLENIKGIL